MAVSVKILGCKLHPKKIAQKQTGMRFGCINTIINGYDCFYIRVSARILGCKLHPKKRSNYGDRDLSIWKHGRCLM
jgi:hypothetical protein